MVSASVHAGTHPLWADTRPRPDTPPWPDTRQQTATAADGTHPTGMHSCFQMSSVVGCLLVI